MKQPPGVLPDLLLGYICEFLHLPVSMPLDTLGVKFQTNKDPSVGVMVSEKERRRVGTSTASRIAMNCTTQTEIHSALRCTPLLL